MAKSASKSPLRRRRHDGTWEGRGFVHAEENPGEKRGRSALQPILELETGNRGISRFRNSGDGRIVMDGE